MAKKLRVLVIEDNQANIASAKKMAKKHHVVVCDTIQSAYATLEGTEEFDAVLTDLFMPLGSFNGAMNTQRYAHPLGELPAGLVFAIKAANKGIRTVICTDADHHSDWICALLDLVGNARFKKDDPRRMISYVEARSVDCSKNDDYIVKNWKEAMEYSGLFPEPGK